MNVPRNPGRPKQTKRSGLEDTPTAWRPQPVDTPLAPASSPCFPLLRTDQDYSGDA